MKAIDVHGKYVGRVIIECPRCKRALTIDRQPICVLEQSSNPLQKNYRLQSLRPSFMCKPCRTEYTLGNLQQLEATRPPFKFLRKRQHRNDRITLGLGAKVAALYQCIGYRNTNDLARQFGDILEHVARTMETRIGEHRCFTQERLARLFQLADEFKQLYVDFSIEDFE